MPKHIKTKDKERMFPFEFYNELSEKMTEYKFCNKAFDRGINIEEEKRRKLYEKIRKTDLINLMNENNIIEIEPFGEVLILDLCVKIGDKLKEDPMRLMVVQLYDSSNKGIFTKEVTDKTIEKIPEILWDDPNLMISILSLANEKYENSEIATLKVPEKIEKEYFEKVK